MNETIIRNHNERVKEEDIVFHLGDFCFKNSYNGGEGIRKSATEWESQLKGKIIHIKGNHDKNNSTKTIIHNLTVNFCNETVFCVHKPEHYNSNYKINFVGHVHNNWKTMVIENALLINVGVDVWGFMPHTFQEIISRSTK